MQQMVGLTLMAGMPSVASPVPRRNRGKSRSATVRSFGPSLFCNTLEQLVVS